MGFSEKIRSLGNTLLIKGFITSEQLSNAHDISEKTGKPLSEVLVNEGYITEDAIRQAVGQTTGSSKKTSISDYSVTDDLISKLPATVVQIFQVFPLQFSDGVLTVAMEDPLNVQIIDDLKFRLGFDVKGVQVDISEIRENIKQYYGQSGDSVQEVIKEISEDKKQQLQMAMESAANEIDAGQLKDLANQAPVIKLLNLVLLQAVKDQASDIHFEPFEDDFKIRYRVDGVLYEMAPPPKSLALAMASRIKVMANLDISERRLPQDGRILMQLADTQVDLRVSTLPTAYGESVVLRVLDKSVVSLSLDKIGMDAPILSEFRKLIRKPNGILLVTGPTGSGKTTTLYSALTEINEVESKIITTEDPVEYEIDGIIQLPVKPQIELTFARCLRAILRQDPDIIMVGEIRDEETAQIAVQSSLTGHLVFSTLHTNDAPGAVTRLLDMGIEPFLITSSLEAVLAQRLVRTICQNCKAPYTPSEEVIVDLGLNPNDMKGRQFYAGRGCEKCNHSGYKGRAGIYELFLLNDLIRDLILERAPAVVLRQKAQETGMKTLRQFGVMRIFEGITTPDEVLRETQTHFT